MELSKNNFHLCFGGTSFGRKSRRYVAGYSNPARAKDTKLFLDESDDQLAGHDRSVEG
jgi:hypothetical protein